MPQLTILANARLILVQGLVVLLGVWSCNFQVAWSKNVGHNEQGLELDTQLKFLYIPSLVAAARILFSRRNQTNTAFGAGSRTTSKKNCTRMRLICRLFILVRHTLGVPSGMRRCLFSS